MQAILDALEQQLREGGMKEVGVNVVAKRAGVSKELIYRYFDGLPGLLMAWMQGHDYWSSRGGMLTAEDTSNQPPAELIRRMLREQAAILHNDDALGAVRCWELVEQDETTQLLGQRREVLARTFADRLDGLTDEVDLPPILGILLAAILYLSLRSRTETMFLGVPLRTPEGWQRFWGAVDTFLGALPPELRQTSLEALETARAPPS